MDLSSQCVDENGEITSCNGFLLSSNKCTSNQPLLDIIDEGCIGMHFTFFAGQTIYV